MAGIGNAIQNLFSSTRGANMTPQPGVPHNQPGLQPNTNNPAQQSQQTNDPAKANNGNVNNTNAPGTVPGQEGQNANTPVDFLAGLWDNTPNEGPDPTQFKFPGIDPKKLGESVSQLDFTRNINPEQMTKALGGDVTAFKDVMNAVARESFSNAFQASGRFAGQAFDGYDKSVTARIPKEFRSLQDSFTIQSSDSLKQFANDPLFAPAIEAVQSRVRAKFPDATPDEVAQATQQWLGKISSRFNTNQSESDNNQPQGKGKSRTVVDFSDF